jgi:hypothetical protein
MSEILQITGLNNATRCAMKNAENEHAITIRDELGMVTLNLTGCSYPAGMTPAQARFVANCLSEAADRVETQAR